MITVDQKALLIGGSLLALLALASIAVAVGGRMAIVTRESAHSLPSSSVSSTSHTQVVEPRCTRRDVHLGEHPFDHHPAMRIEIDVGQCVAVARQPLGVEPWRGVDRRQSQPTRPAVGEPVRLAGPGAE